MHDVIVANGQWHGGAMWLAPEARAGRRPLRRRADRRRDEARLRHDRAEDLQGHVSRPSEGRAPARRAAVSVDAPERAADRARRRAGRDDAGAVRDRPRRDPRACPCVAPRSLAVAFATLAVLVCAGAFTRFDQWGVDHLMPGADFRERQADVRRQPRAAARRALGHLARRRREHRHAAGVVSHSRSRSSRGARGCSRVALLAAVAVEVVCKELIERPALYDGAFHISAFDSSFPSGHTLRTVLVAAAVWPLLRGWAVAWAVASIVLLQLAGWHTPTDILGGVLLGLLALLGARGAGALRARRLARA